MRVLKMLQTFAVVSALSLSGSAWALTINAGATEVGSLDLFLGSTILGNSGDGTEKSWVAAMLGLDVEDLTLEFKNNDASEIQAWTQVDGAAAMVKALQLDEPVYYYLLKLGVPAKSGADTHYLFDNQASLNWAVIDFNAMLAGQPESFSFNFGRVSHISGFNGAVTVPEPGTLALLGLGLVAIGVVRRRQKA